MGVAWLSSGADGSASQATVGGVGVLVLAVNPAIGVFGLLTVLSVLYAYLTSIFVLPSVLALWHRGVTRQRQLTSDWSITPSSPAPNDD